jgi:hypothetical protein
MRNLVASCAFSAFAFCLSGNVASAQSPGSGPTPKGPASGATKGGSAVAPPVEYLIEDSNVVALRDTVKTKLGIPSGVVAIIPLGNRLYVARGTLGVAVYDITDPLSPRLEREQATNGGSANGFTLVDGQVWMLVSSKMAMPVGDVGPSAAGQVGPSTSASAATASSSAGQVPVAAPSKPTVATAPAAEPSDVPIRLVSPGVIEIVAGAEQGVKIGDRYTLLRAERRTGVAQEQFEGERIVGTAEVVAVRADSALAEVSRTATARSNDYVRKSKRTAEEESNAFPLRVPNMGEVGIVLRPLINIGTPLGVGVLADLEATYWGSAYFAGASVQPLGFGTTANGSVVSIAALAEGGYDGHAFAAGLGAGIGWVNGDIDNMLWGSTSSDNSTGSTTTTTKQDTHSAFAVSQVVRLGARDGLRLQLRNVLLLHRESATSPRGFIYGGTSGKLVVATGRRADVFCEGGGGVMGYWFFGIGVGTWVIGNGSPGSLHLAVSAGGAGISGSRQVTQTYTNPMGQPTSYSYDDTIDIAGPMVSIGITRRFEF